MTNFWKKKSSGVKSNQPPKKANLSQRVKWYKQRRRREPSVVIPYGVRQELEKGPDHEL